KLPILGTIPAGGPVVTEEYINGWMTVGEDIAKNATDYFLLTVSGQSMIEAGIYEGDLAVVDTKKTPKDGDIVIALVDNQNTLKRYMKKDGKVYLKAENKDYKDIYPENELVIQGVVSTLIRQL
ncbi:repressor LexA, partial [Patescibacteria group bacterium]|nr:repressor LexA [Patescibacteria group bacterium]